MTGERDLNRLIAGMTPVLQAEVYVFATTEGVPPPALMQFQEAEGVTVILTREDAVAADLRYEFPCRMITLEIHSALDAVGFLAAITTRLAAAGMGVNPVSAFHHDHLFVPVDRADDAMEILRQMVAEAG